MRPGLSSTTCPTRRELHDSALCCILYKVCRADIGAMAQLVAHLHGMERVRGSNPLSSTNRVFRGIWKPFFSCEKGGIPTISRHTAQTENVRKCTSLSTKLVPTEVPELSTRLQYWNHAHKIRKRRVPCRPQILQSEILIRRTCHNEDIQRQAISRSMAKRRKKSCRSF